MPSLMTLPSSPHYAAYELTALFLQSKKLANFLLVNIV